LFIDLDWKLQKLKVCTFGSESLLLKRREGMVPS
jgi:hypothetical protein